MKRVLLPALAGLFCLLAVEAGFRVLNLYPPPGGQADTMRRDYYVADSVVGYHLWPSTRTCFRYPPGTHRVLELISNSDGFASSRELGGADPRPRILVLGDSFTMGVGVEEGQRFTEVLEAIEPSWRVDNLGMAGWGLDLMVRALEAFGAKADPDVVVLAFYTDDFRRLQHRYAGTGYLYRKFDLRGDSLVDVPLSPPTRWDRLRLVELVRRVRESRDRNRFALNEALIERFRILTERLDAEPVILFLPGRADTPEDRTRRAALAQWARDRAIVFADLTDPLHTAGVEETYLKDNWHWNEQGHRIAAQALHGILSSMNVPTDVVEAASAPTAPWRLDRAPYCRDAGG